MCNNIMILPLFPSPLLMHMHENYISGFKGNNVPCNGKSCISKAVFQELYFRWLRHYFPKRWLVRGIAIWSLRYK